MKQCVARTILVRLMAALWLTWLTMAMLPSRSFAQDPRARIMGTVTDSSGAVVPGVLITAVNTETQVGVSTRSTNDGRYDILYLNPGVYSVRAEGQGFKQWRREDLELRTGDRVTVDIGLEPGVITETVTVSAAVPLLETNTASLGQVVDTRRITELPVAGGNVGTLVRLSAGVVNYAPPNHPSLGVDQVNVVGVAGTGSRNSEWMMDGAPVMQGRNAAVIPPADTVAEFRVQTSSYDASLGHSPGGAFNVTLKSGTNLLHGTLYEMHFNQALQAMDLFQRRNFFNTATGAPTAEKLRQTKPTTTMNRYGASVSGPVVAPHIYSGRDRTFFMFGFEQTHRPAAAPQEGYFRTVPTLKQRQGDFSDLLPLGANYQIYDPATIAPAASGRFSRLPLPGNILPPARLDPLARRLLDYWPAPNTTGTADGRNNYFRPVRNQNHLYTYLARVDHNVSSRHRIFGRSFFNDQWFDQNTYFPNQAVGYKRRRGGKGLGFDSVYTISPTFLVNFRYSWTRFVDRFTSLSDGFDFTELGFSQVLAANIPSQALTLPALIVDAFQKLGGCTNASSCPSSSYTNYHSWALDFAKTAGRHSLRWGVEYRLFREHNYNFTSTTPELTFASTWTSGPFDNSPAAPLGQGLASFLLGIPSRGTASINPSTAEQSTYAAGFVQDDFRITPKLTVTFGLRYEYEFPLTERFNRAVRGFDFVTPNPIEAPAKANYAQNPIPELPVQSFRATGGLLSAGVTGAPRTLWSASGANFAPRAGMAYSVTPRLVVRAGYGLYYVPVGADREAPVTSGFGRSTELVPSVDNGRTFIASLRNPFPDGFLQPLGAAGGLSTQVGNAAIFFSERRPNPYMQRWSVNIQRALPGEVLFNISYVGNKMDRGLVSKPVNALPEEYLSTSPVRDQATIDRLSAQVANPFFPMLPGTGLAARTVSRAQLLLPYPHFTGLTKQGESIGKSSYHSMELQITRRWKANFTVEGNYTWSKLIEQTGFLNASDVKPEKVISSEDRPHRLTLSGIWELPFGFQQPFGRNLKGLLNHLAGGWQLSVTGQLQSGAPISFGNIIYDGNLHDIPLPRGQRSVDRWFNVDAGFERDSRRQLQYNIRRLSSRFNGIRSHDANLWDAAIIKNFRLREGWKLQLRSEWMNALNRSFFASPNINPVSTAFGAITATQGWARQIHLGLKLVF